MRHVRDALPMQKIRNRTAESVTTLSRIQRFPPGARQLSRARNKPTGTEGQILRARLFALHSPYTYLYYYPTLGIYTASSSTDAENTDRHDTPND
jgi:hypothetical protein